MTHATWQLCSAENSTRVMVHVAVPIPGTSRSSRKDRLTREGRLDVEVVFFRRLAPVGLALSLLGRLVLGEGAAASRRERWMRLGGRCRGSRREERRRPLGLWWEVGTWLDWMYARMTLEGKGEGELGEQRRIRCWIREVRS